MKLKAFARAGHWPTLLCAFLYFDVSFMVWILVGALGVFIAEEFALAPAQKGVLVAVPVLAGGVLRLVMGPATDRWGPKRVGMVGMALTVVPLLWAGFAPASVASVVGVGVLLGVAGASFAVALPLASRAYPPEHQGLAMGIAGAGNSGTVVATLLAPRLAEIVGWRGVFQLAVIPVLAVLIAFALAVRDRPTAPPAARAHRRLLAEWDLWWLNGFYAVTFGGFVGLASFLPIFFRDQYGSSPAAAGGWAAVCVLAGSLLRPLGGYLADRLGGIGVLGVLYTGVAMAGTLIAQLPGLPVMIAMLALLMAALGMGNGAVFQLVGQRFRHDIGVASGIIGASGAMGGFLLPSALGVLKETHGSYGSGFALFAVAAASAAMALWMLQREWQRTWARLRAELAAP